MASSVPSSIVEVSMPALKWSQPLRLLLTIPPLLAFPWLGWRLLSVPPEPVLLIDGIVSNQLGLDRRPSWSASLSRLFWTGIVPSGTGGATARVSLPLLVRDGSRWALWTAHGTFTRHGGLDLSWRIQSLFLWDRTLMASSATPSLLRQTVKAGLQSGTVMMIGDAVAQTFVGTEAYAPGRSARFALVGCTLHGPYFFMCFRQLDRFFGPAVNLRTVLKKTAVAQVTVFPAYIVALFAYLGLLDGASSIADNVAKKAPEAFIAGCGFWPVANTFGFKL
ncbi:hypothetical protein FOL46_009658 [Perkinsus olseni]|uniref:Uncharacterized protein n=1 Tax=Perkinsus olseni TaxID=32597 RepID=A0A7J6MK55_PEROL|nr:hypothetical protein FOL46_009658 [Perkinsus olseni]